MSVAGEHRFRFTASAIADAADARAMDLEAEVYELQKQRDDAYGKVSLAVADQLERMVAREKMGGHLICDTAYWDGEQRRPDGIVYPAVAIEVDGQVWQEFTYADRAFRHKMGKAARYREQAATYRSQVGTAHMFELDADDVHYFGLDRE